MTKTKFSGLRAFIQGVHYVGEVFVDVDIKFFERGHVVKLVGMGR